MSCSNKVPFHVQRGYSFRQIEIQCGRTDPYGGRAICDECYDNAEKLAEIQRQEADIAADNEAARSAGFGEY